MENDAVCCLLLSALVPSCHASFLCPACLIAHNCCEVVSVTLCSATRDICGGSGDLQGRPVRVAPLAEHRFCFVQDLAFDMAQFLVSWKHTWWRAEHFQIWLLWCVIIFPPSLTQKHQVKVCFSVSSLKCDSSLAGEHSRQSGRPGRSPAAGRVSDSPAGVWAPGWELGAGSSSPCTSSRLELTGEQADQQQRWGWRPANCLDEVQNT